jgi:hypothetical protein
MCIFFRVFLQAIYPYEQFIPTVAHTSQMETLIKSTTDTMKEMLTLMNTNVTPNTTNQTNEEKKKKREEKRKKYCKTPECKHCGKKHPTKKEDKFWELE